MAKKSKTKIQNQPNSKYRQVKVYFMLMLTFGTLVGYAQTSLQSLVAQARTTSPEAKVLELSNEQNGYNNSLQLVSLKPSLSLTSNLPGFTRSINSITQPDGSLKFQTQSQAYSSLGISASQAIAPTGGRISLTSGLNRIDLFDPSNNTAWSSNLFVATVSQPLFQFNELKYLKPNLTTTQKLNNARYEQSVATFNQQIAALVLDYYYAAQQVKLLTTQLTKQTETINRTAYLVEAGKILQEDVDLLELERKNAENQLQNIRISLSGLEKQLAFHYGNTAIYQQIEKLNLTELPPAPSKDNLQALAANSPTLLANAQAQELAKQNVIRQKQNKGLSANVDVSFGYNQQADQLAGIYENPLDRQMASLSVSVPILDGGRAKYNRLIAQNQLEQAELSEQISTQSVNQQIENVLNQFEQLTNELNLAQASITLAQNRETKYANLFAAGKITVDQYLEAQNYRQNIELTLLQARVSYWKLRYALVF